MKQESRRYLVKKNLSRWLLQNLLSGLSIIIVLAIPAYSQTATEMCRNMRESAKCCMTPAQARAYQPYIRKMCAGGAAAKRYAYKTNALRKESQRRQSEETANAVGSFVLGLATGFLEDGGFSRGEGRYVNHGHVVHAVPRVVTPSAAMPTVAHAAPTFGPTSSPVVHMVGTPSGAPFGAKDRPIGYIRQPNGKLDPYYSKPPCATMKWDPSTHHAECTNY